MQGSNRSGIQCYEHPNEQITNYCVHYECLRPLCPDCVEIHTKQHQTQQIQSWKHCINKSGRNVKTTLDTLRTIYEQQNRYRAFKGVDTIETENIRKLTEMKEKVLRVVREVFDTHEMRLRAIIRNHYKIDPPDTTKLKMAIEELDKILMKLGNNTTVLPALKKSLQLDHQSLLSYFGELKNNEKRIPNTQVYIHENFDSIIKLKSIMEGCVSINPTHSQDVDYDNNYRSPAAQKYNQYNKNQYRQQNREIRSESREIRPQPSYPFSPLKISQSDYFNADCKFKWLHFFVPQTKQLKIIELQDAQTQKSWKTVNFKAKYEVPDFFQSLITPKGEIYLTGGCYQEKRSKQIYRYNPEKLSLDFVCKMLTDRSSHTLCYLNNAIYIMGGFTKLQKQITNNCEVFRLDTQSCEPIASMITPTANSSAASFNNEYIFKFGGSVDRSNISLHLIEMYSVKTNKWQGVDIETNRNIPRLEMLSCSAAVQINQKEILFFGGYRDDEGEKPERTSYALVVNTTRGCVTVKNYNSVPLTFAEGFWSNNPIIHRSKVYALQNVTDEQDANTVLADERRIITFQGQRWG